MPVQHLQRLAPRNPCVHRMEHVLRAVQILARSGRNTMPFVNLYPYYAPVSSLRGGRSERSNADVVAG